MGSLGVGSIRKTGIKSVPGHRHLSRVDHQAQAFARRAARAAKNTNGAAGGEPPTAPSGGALDVIGYPTWIVPLMTAQCPGKLQKNS